MFLTALLLIGSPMQAAAAPAASPQVATGTFDVSVAPQTGDGPVGVLALDKTYHGALEAKATGRMLGAGAPDTGTAAYVALEQVTGTVAGRRGGFMLQHSGWMNAGKQVMTVTIAPGSGTGELVGIAGDMDIVIEGATHRYVLRYTLPK